MSESIHKTAHPLVGQVAEVVEGMFKGEQYRLEDWWDRLGQGSWKVCTRNPACIEYGVRVLLESIPQDDEVVYGKINGLGKLIHVTQLGDTPVTNLP